MAWCDGVRVRLYDIAGVAGDQAPIVKGSGLAPRPDHPLRGKEEPSSVGLERTSLVEVALIILKDNRGITVDEELEPHSRALPM